MDGVDTDAPIPTFPRLLATICCGDMPSLSVLATSGVVMGDFTGAAGVCGPNKAAGFELVHDTGADGFCCALALSFELDAWLADVFLYAVFLAEEADDLEVPCIACVPLVTFA